MCVCVRAAAASVAGGLIKRLTFCVRSGLCSEKISEVGKCFVVLDLCVCLLI